MARTEGNYEWTDAKQKAFERAVETFQEDQARRERCLKNRNGETELVCSAEVTDGLVLEVIRILEGKLKDAMGQEFDGSNYEMFITSLNRAVKNTRMNSEAGYWTPEEIDTFMTTVATTIRIYRNEQPFAYAHAFPEENYYKINRVIDQWIITLEVNLGMIER